MVIQSQKPRQLLTLVIRLVIAVLIAELVFRFMLFAVPFPRKDFVRACLAWHTRGTMRAVNEAASYVRFRPSRQHEDLNSHGFHSPEVPFEKPPGTQRIAFFGGSTTYNKGPLSETYPCLVDSLLRANGLRTDYINAGANGYTSTESFLTYYFRVRMWEPDLVVFYNGRNDIILSGSRWDRPEDLTDLLQPPYSQLPPRWHQSISRILNTYALAMEVLGCHAYWQNNWRILYRRDRRFARRSGHPRSVNEFIANVRTGEVFEVYRWNVEALALLTAHTGANVLLVGFASCPEALRSSGIPRDRPLTAEEVDLFRHTMSGLNRILEETAERFPHVFFHSLEGRIDRQRFLDDCHLDSQGRRQKASIIGQFILDHRREFGW